eukprot:COSAG02_NODE_1005_length_15270_cov_11.414607_11_plen_203_part_00
MTRPPSSTSAVWRELAPLIAPGTRSDYPITPRRTTAVPVSVPLASLPSQTSTAPITITTTTLTTTTSTPFTPAPPTSSAEEEPEQQHHHRRRRRQEQQNPEPEPEPEPVQEQEQEQEQFAFPAEPSSPRSLLTTRWPFVFKKILRPKNRSGNSILVNLTAEPENSEPWGLGVSGPEFQLEIAAQSDSRIILESDWAADGKLE